MNIRSLAYQAVVTRGECLPPPNTIDIRDEIIRGVNAMTGQSSVMTHHENIMSWNPLDDDAECARMETALLISVIWGTDGVTAAVLNVDGAVSVLHEIPEEYVLYSDCGGDKGAARRLASTKMAARLYVP